MLEDHATCDLQLIASHEGEGQRPTVLVKGPMSDRRWQSVM